jgi:hypothetical protein
MERNGTPESTGKFNPFDNPEQYLAGSDTTVDDLLKHAGERVFDAGYPRRGCLPPATLSSYSVTGYLSSEEEAHILKCSTCKGLLTLLVPDDESANRFAQAIKSVRATAHSGSRAGHREHARLDESLSGWQRFPFPIAAVVLCAVLLGTVYGVHAHNVAAELAAERRAEAERTATATYVESVLRIERGQRHVSSTVSANGDDHIAPASRQKVAATAATLQNTTLVKGTPGSPSDQILQDFVTAAVRKLALASIALPTESGSQSVYSVHLNCKTLKRAMPTETLLKRVSISDAREAGNCVFSNPGSETEMILDTRGSVASYHQYLTALKKSDGALDALNSASEGNLDAKLDTKASRVPDAIHSMTVLH